MGTGDNGPFRFWIWLKYFVEIIRNGSPARLQCFRREPSQVDFPLNKFDVFPVQLHDFINAQPGEQSDREEGIISGDAHFSRCSAWSGERALIGFIFPLLALSIPFGGLFWATPISQLVILASQICDIFRLTIQIGAKFDNGAKSGALTKNVSFFGHRSG
jgi:hypothetical protein